MRKLTDGTNVDAPTTDYPNGRVRDKAGATPGTIGNEVLLGDITQLFQKLVIDSGITENDTPDNVTNGYQLLEALQKNIGNRCVCNGEYDGTSDSIIFQSGIIGVTFTKVSTGAYRIYFPAAKRYVVMCQLQNNDLTIRSSNDASLNFTVIVVRNFSSALTDSGFYFSVFETDL